SPSGSSSTISSAARSSPSSCTGWRWPPSSSRSSCAPDLDVRQRQGDRLGSERALSYRAMTSRRVLRSYQARYSMGANKASMYDLTDAIDVHAHARGHDEEDPLHAAQEASRAGMKAILYKSISPGRPWEVARRVQEDVDRWAEKEGVRPVHC